MAKELKEELGILEPTIAEDLRLIALGIDTERYLIQFSYLWVCPYTAQEINMRKVNHASRQGKSEQLTLFALFRPDLHRDYLKLLQSAQFEPGAAYPAPVLQLVWATNPITRMPFFWGKPFAVFLMERPA